jgi:hypothetical protein
MSNATEGDGRTAEAILSALISPNVSDSNLEATNVVDVIHDLAQAIRHGLRSLGAIEAHGKAILDSSERISNSLDGIADAISNLARVIQEGRAS